MKKLKYIFMPICLVLCSMFFLVGCGEEFIVEQTYQLLGMQIIVDNTVAEGYSQYESGEFTTSLSGSIDLQESTIDVKRTRSVLVWEHEGIVAKYYFDLISGSDEYPTFSYTSYTATYNDVSFTNLTAEVLATIEYYVEDVITLDAVLKQGESNIQLLAQKRTFSAYISIVNRESNEIVLMAQLYGINQ